MKILINVQDMHNNLEIRVDYDNNKMFINDQICSYDARVFAARLVAITYDWPERLEDAKVFDGERYSIKIQHNHKITEKVGINKFPDNYVLFKVLLSEVDNVRTKNN